MRNVCYALLTIFLVIGFFNSSSAQQNDQEFTHRLLRIKFKAGKATEGMNIGKQYFSKAYAAAGHATEVFEFDGEGEWDGLVVIPLSAGEPEEGQAHPKAVLEEMIKIAGGEAALEKINERFFSYIEQQQMALVRLERF